MTIGTLTLALRKQRLKGSEGDEDVKHPTRTRSALAARRTGPMVSRGHEYQLSPKDRRLKWSGTYRTVLVAAPSPSTGGSPRKAFGPAKWRDATPAARSGTDGPGGRLRVDHHLQAGG